MKKSLPVLITIAMAATAVAQSQSPMSVANGGWTLTLDAGRSSLTVTHATVGAVMKDVRLSLREGKKLTPLENWQFSKTGDNRLNIRTEGPRTGWQLEVVQNTLKISSTSTHAVLTATVPATRDRNVARLLDPQGTPVDWVGTAEVAHGYGGSETRNPSFLPRRNPDCMYFSLGNISGGAFHSLFDQKTDTAIDFSDGTVLKRRRNDANLLDMTMPVVGNAAVRLSPEYFAKTLGVPYYARFDDSYFSRAPMVWSSWTSYYEAVREEDIVQNADWLATHLKPYGFEYVQLDDGYDRGKAGEHYWIENWDREKFPHGPEWLANYIKSKGLRPGIWIVPNAYAGAVPQHPEWYLHDKHGKIILDYSTPALDSSNPEVLAFVGRMFNTLDGWGFEYYKFDGEHALPRYIPAVDHDKLYDRNADPLAVYRDRLQLIRRTIGPKRFIEGCPAGTPLNGLGYFNSYFTGHDLYNNWQGMYPLFSSVNANAFLNHMVVYVMPGEGLELGLPMTVDEALEKRPRIVVDTARSREYPMTGFGITAAEARTLVTYVALTGVAYPLASVMSELPEERVQLLKATMPTMPILPVDLFSRGTDAQWDTFKHTQPDFYIHNYPEILDLKVNAASGVYDVVGLTNWRGGKILRDLDLVDKLGLDRDTRYVAFDFWSQRVLGVFQNRLQIEIEPHDTRVLLIHPLLNTPQIVGNSRHITGAYSVIDQSWDTATRTLRGSLETVDGEPYTLWAYLPDGVSLSRLRVSAKGGAELPARLRTMANSLAVSFGGQSQPVRWEMVFSSK